MLKFPACRNKRIPLEGSLSGVDDRKGVLSYGGELTPNAAENTFLYLQSLQSAFNLSFVLRSLNNLTIFVTQEKRMDFSEVTGVRALFFRNLSVGETAGPDMSGQCGGGKTSP